MNLFYFLHFIAFFIIPLDCYSWESIQRIEGAVNSDVILTTDVDRFKKTTLLRSQIDPLFANTPFAQKINQVQKSDIRDFLIEELLILQQFPVSDAEVEQEIASIQSNNNLSREELKNALSAQGFSFEDYFQLIRIGTSKRNLIDREIRSRAIITEEDVKNYYHNFYSKSKNLPYEYKIKILSFNSKSNADSALKFAKTTGELESSSAIERLETDYVQEAEIQPMFREVLSRLSPGEISTVVGDSRSGYFILKLIDKKLGIDAEFEKVKDEIRSKLSTIEYQRQIKLWIEKQLASSYIHRVAP